VTTLLADNFGAGFSSFFPLHLRGTRNSREQTARVQETPDLFFAANGGAGGGGGDATKPNLTPAASAYLTKLGAEPEALFFLIVATLHAPAYRAENAGALRQDWPRVPLPKTRDALNRSAALGRQVAALLDPETPVPGVTTGKVRAELRQIAVLDGNDLRVTAGWGIAGKGGVAMPGKGKIETISGGTPKPAARHPNVERKVETPPGGAPAPAETARWPVTHGIFLNDVTQWRGVPEAVWDYTLGGYQVLKKWLSYRESALLGRALTMEEAREFTHIARRIAALRMLQPELDRNYAAAKTETEPLSAGGR
jgi:type ISP restriction-modification system protein